MPTGEEYRQAFLRYYETSAWQMTDDQLIAAMFENPDTARIAKRIYDQRHAGDQRPMEPRHCAECFEGCPKRQPSAAKQEWADLRRAVRSSA